MNDDRHDEGFAPDGTPEPDALLTAYLFDELDAAERLDLERRLANEPGLAARLEELRGTLALLRRATLDAGPAELAASRRDSLRAAAAEATGADAGPADARRRGRLLGSPWMGLAVAAGLALSFGFLFQWGPGSGPPVASGASDEARLQPEERMLLESSGYSDESASRPEGAVSERSAKTRGDARYALEAPTREAERGMLQELGYADPDLAGDPEFTVNSAFDSESWNSSPGKRNESALLGARARRIPESEAEKWISLFGHVTAPSTDRDGETTLGVGGGAGGQFRGPGDSVPPAAGATATPSTPSTPTTPSTPSTPPAPGAASGLPDQADTTPQAGLYFEEAARWEDRAQTEDIVGDYAGSEADFGEGLIDLDDVTAGLERRRPASVADGYGRRYRGQHIVDHLRPVHEHESPRDMFFRYYGDNPFVDAAHDALSTFAVDVDTASYPLARNYLRNGQLPPRAAVRTEEVVNYFDQGLEPPQEGTFAVHLDAAPTPYGSEPGNLLLRVGVKAVEVSREERLPMNVVFVVDKSGSMRSDNRLELVKRSLELVLDQLRDDDRIGIVAFDQNGEIVLESTRGSERWKARESLRGLQPGGSTNAAEGLFLGYEMLDRHYLEHGINRVVLASDGVANTGETDQRRILDRVEDFTARRVDLTTIGVGMGNHNDVFLEQLADQGDGACHYVDGFDEAKRVFLDEFTGTVQTVARDTKIQVEFDPAQVKSWRQLGYENRSLRDDQFRDDTVDAGEVGAGHEIVALYELQLADAVDADTVTGEAEAVAEDTARGALPLATVRLRWRPDAAFDASRVALQNAIDPFDELDVDAEPPVVEQAWTLDAAEVVADWEETRPRYRLAAVAAEYAEFLRRSYHARGDSYDRLERDAELLVAELSGDEHVRELRGLIHGTRKIVHWREPGGELWRLIEECRRLTLLQQELRRDERNSAAKDEALEALIQQNQKLEQRIRDLLDERD